MRGSLKRINLHFELSAPRGCMQGRGSRVDMMSEGILVLASPPLDRVCAGAHVNLAHEDASF